MVVLAADIDILDHNLEQTLLGLMPDDQACPIRCNRQVKDRQRRILARLLLAYGLNLLDGWDVRTGLASLRQDRLGRPWISGSSRPASISHAGRWAVGCVGPADAHSGVGVDVEEIKPLDADDFSLVFTLHEREDIRKAGNPAEELIRRWTIKEAVLKAAGTGLLADPLRIDTAGNGVAGGVRWRHLPLSQGYWLTVAGLAHGVTPRLVLPSRGQLLATFGTAASRPKETPCP